MSPRPTGALGLRVKTGWAAVVLLGGSKTAPQLLDSRILTLAEPGTRQPYHAGSGKAQTDERKIEQLTRRIARFSNTNIRKLIAEYATTYRLESTQTVVSSLVDPMTITNPHMRAHANEGRLFGSVVVRALDRCGLGQRLVLERNVFQELSESLGRSVARLKAQVAELGEGQKPWRAEQKVAAAAAWPLLPD